MNSEDVEYLKNIPPCKLHPLRLYEQKFDIKIIKNCLIKTYDNIAFSTIPYKLYNVNNSKNALQKFNSGNCIAFTMFIKDQLRKNYKINSYIIPASVPDMFRVNGTRHLTHVSLFIPLSLTEFMIIDPALYFLEPIICNLNITRQQSIMTKNIYDKSDDKIIYSINHNPNRTLGDNQDLPEDAMSVECYYEKFPQQLWDYYLVEVSNPDESIGKPFLYLKKEPFITVTKVNYGTNRPELIYNVKLKEDGRLYVKMKDKVIIDDNVEKLTDIYNKTNDISIKKKLDLVDYILKNQLRKYLTNFTY